MIVIDIPESPGIKTMKTIYLHIGTFKTGTSSIQGFLHRQREALAELGYLVPSSAAPGHHELPISLIREHSEFRGPWPKVDKSSDELWGELTEEIDNSECGKVIISAETFCDLVNEHCIEQSDQMGQQVSAHLGKYQVKVICYIREILPYMRSMYGETIKITPRYLSFKEQVSLYVKQGSFHISPTVFLDFYEKLFGRDAMVVREYKRDRLTGGDVVYDFADTIGLESDQIAALMEGSNPRLMELNTSIDPESMNLKRAFNLAGVLGPDVNRQVSDVLKGAEELASEPPEEHLLDQTLTGFIDSEQQDLNSRYKLCLEPADPGILSAPETRRSADDLYMIGLLGLNIRRSIGLQKKIQQTNEQVSQLQEQHRQVMHELAILRQGVIRRAISAIKRRAKDLLSSIRDR